MSLHNKKDATHTGNIEFYRDRIQRFVDSGCKSKAVIKRWLEKISALQQKKSSYEEILHRYLDDLEQDYRMRQMPGQELQGTNGDPNRYVTRHKNQKNGGTLCVAVLNSDHCHLIHFN